jgi:hypothetical protein
MPSNPGPARTHFKPGADFNQRFLDQPCLALFDRGGLHSRLQVQPLGALSNLDAAVDWLDDRNAALV